MRWIFDKLLFASMSPWKLSQNFNHFSGFPSNSGRFIVDSLILSPWFAGPFSASPRFSFAGRTIELARARAWPISWQYRSSMIGCSTSISSKSSICVYTFLNWTHVFWTNPIFVCNVSSGSPFARNPAINTSRYVRRALHVPRWRFNVVEPSTISKQMYKYSINTLQIRVIKRSKILIFNLQLVEKRRWYVVCCYDAWCPRLSVDSRTSLLQSCGMRCPPYDSQDFHFAKMRQPYCYRCAACTA